MKRQTGDCETNRKFYFALFLGITVPEGRLMGAETPFVTLYEFVQCDVSLDPHTALPFWELAAETAKETRLCFDLENFLYRKEWESQSSLVCMDSCVIVAGNKQVTVDGDVRCM